MKEYSKFIEVSLGNERKTLVNVNQIMKIRKRPTGSSIHMNSNQEIIITKESYEEVKAMLPNVVSITDIKE